MAKPAVLVVASYAVMRSLIQDYLELHGIQVWTASSGELALALLKHLQPDLLLCELELPDGEGHALLRQWRAHEAAQAKEPIPAIALTTENSFTYRSFNLTEMAAGGFQAYVQKPFDPEYLWTIMTVLLSLSPREIAGQAHLDRAVLSIPSG